MFRWVLTIFLAVVVFSSLLPWLEKLGIGRLPGDLRFRLFGRDFSFSVCLDDTDFAGRVVAGARLQVKAIAQKNAGFAPILQRWPIKVFTLFRRHFNIMNRQAWQQSGGC
jgi:hypothetical protein